jgi:phage-related protein
MIQLQIAVHDEAKSVLLTGHTDSDYVQFYRQVGQTDPVVVSPIVPAVDGVATYIDTAPPEKTLLTYYAVDATQERSKSASGVLPTYWQLQRPVLAGDIRLGNLIFNTVDSNGTIWTISDIEGWWSIPEANVPTSVRARDEDGSYDEDGRYLAREFTVSGVFLPTSPELIEASRARLIKELDAVRRTVLLRVDETPPRQMAVRVAGHTVIQTVRQSGLTEFSVDLRAADPVKYALERMKAPGGVNAPIVVGAGLSAGPRTYPRQYDVATDNLREYGPIGAPNFVSIVNEGNYKSSPIIRVFGPVTNPRIELVDWDGKTSEDPIEEMSFVITLQAGEFLEINVKEKTVLLNGMTSRRGTMTFQSDWFMLRPGMNTLQYTALVAPGNTTVLDIEAYSAWLG